jgi:hypothetical protein
MGSGECYPASDTQLPRMMCITWPAFAGNDATLHVLVSMSLHTVTVAGVEVP